MKFSDVELYQKISDADWQQIRKEVSSNHIIRSSPHLSKWDYAKDGFNFDKKHLVQVLKTERDKYEIVEVQKCIGDEFDKYRYLEEHELGPRILFFVERDYHNSPLKRYIEVESKMNNISDHDVKDNAVDNLNNKNPDLMLPKLPKPSKSFGTKVYRFLSFLFVIFVIIPLFVVVSFLNMILSILNDLTFYNYQNSVLPDEALKHLGTGANSYGVMKFLFVVYSPIYMFWHEVKDGIKSMKY